MSYEPPRRIRIDLFTPAEKAIWDAVQVVEAAGCDERLTRAVIKLSEARDLVADFVDGVPLGDGYPRPIGVTEHGDKVYPHPPSEPSGLGQEVKGGDRG